MERFVRSNSNMDEKAVGGRSTKSAHRIRGRNATPESTVTQSASRSLGWLKAFTFALAVSSPLVAECAQEVHDTTAALSIRSSHSADLSQRGTLHHLPESTDIASSSDSRRQYKNMGPDQYFWLRGGDVKLPWPTINDVERLLQDAKVQKEILHACQDPEYVKGLLSLTKNKKFMDSIRPIFLDEQHLITFLSGLCQDLKVRDNFVALATDKQFMDNIRPLLNDKGVENLKRSLEARQEEARSHSLGATQEPFERQKGSMRKLLQERRWGPRKYHKEPPIVYNDNPDSPEHRYIVVNTPPAEIKPDNNPKPDLAIELLKAELQRCHSTNHTLIIGIIVVAALGFYCFDKAKKDAGKAKQELTQEKVERQKEVAQLKIASQEALTKERIDRAEEEVRRKSIENDYTRLKIESKLEENYDLQRQMQPPPEPRNDMRPYRDRTMSERPLSRSSSSRNLRQRSSSRQENPE